MKILYIGDYDSDYPRHHVLISGLRKHDVDVVEAPLQSTGLPLLFTIRKVLKMHTDVDIVFVAYSNSRLVWFFRLCTAKPIVWNAFYSLYDNWIHDRKLASAFSVKAFYYWFLDWVCCQTADKIVLETETDIEYFMRTFNIRREKFIKIFVGYNEDLIQPAERTTSPETFVVEFHGKYIPVQGVTYIIEAADLLRKYDNIKFVLIGSGQTYKQVRARAEELGLQNITFIPWVPLTQITGYLADADVALGLLGTVPRVEQAIPNKVYEASGMKRASINADTRAIRELFTDGENILLVKKGDAQDLAEKILLLKNNPQLKARIAENAFQLVRKRASIDILGKELKDALHRVVV